MTITASKCPRCQDDVEIDDTKPTILLDPARDKVKHAWAMHICSGKPKALSLNGQFMRDPKAFLASHVVVVDEHGQDAPVRSLIWRFTLVPADKNAVLLRGQTDTSDDCIVAYWLPWLSKRASSMDLGADADFFFTSEMTNCRFSVLDPNPKAPKVAHVAGDLSTPTARSKAEVDDGFRSLSDAPKVRRLSISGSRDLKPYKQPVIPKVHDYSGQTGEKDKFSSAFTFGVRGSDGNWKFYAQIVKGSMVEGFFNNELTEDLQILSFVEI